MILCLSIHYRPDSKFATLFLPNTIFYASDTEKQHSRGKAVHYFSYIPHHTHSSFLSCLCYQKTGNAWYAYCPIVFAIPIISSSTSCTSSSCSSALLVPKLLVLLLLNILMASLTSPSFRHRWAFFPPVPGLPASH